MTNVMHSETGLQAMMDWYTEHTKQGAEERKEQQQSQRRRVREGLRRVIMAIESEGLSCRGYGQVMEWVRAPTKQERWLRSFEAATAEGLSLATALDKAYTTVDKKAAEKHNIGRNSGQSSILQYMYIAWRTSTSGGTEMAEGGRSERARLFACRAAASFLEGVALGAALTPKYDVRARIPNMVSGRASQAGQRL